MNALTTFCSCIAHDLDENSGRVISLIMVFFFVSLLGMNGEVLDDKIKKV